MSQAACPHCGAMNEVGTEFCAFCGKAMPQAAGAGPRVMKGGALASSRAGQELQSDDLMKKMKSARRILLTLGILQVVLGLIVLGIGLSGAANSATNNPNAGSGLTLVGGIVAGIGLVFLGLAAWATTAPFPAAVTGLVLYVTLTVVDAIADPTAIFRGIIIKVLIIAALAKAVQAGLEHRNLRRRMQESM